MSLHTYDYLDGNAVAGLLGEIFGVDITAAEGRCAHCGAIKRFAEARVYMRCPGVVARCALCEHVLLRMAKIRRRVVLDVRGMAYLSLDTSRFQESANT